MNLTEMEDGEFIETRLVPLSQLLATLNRKLIALDSQSLMLILYV